MEHDDNLEAMFRKYFYALEGRPKRVGTDTTEINIQKLPRAYQDYFSNTTEEKGEPDMTEKLYNFTIDDETKYGTYLAENSMGMFVLEEKGTGKVHTIAKDKCTEVMPFTFAVKFSKDGQQYHFRGNADKIAVGDFLLRTDFGSTFTVCQVTAVDTKSKAATKEFVGVKLVTEAV